MSAEAGRSAFRLIREHFPLGVFLVTGMVLAGCTVGPNYHRPSAPVAAKWDVTPPWRESTPNDSIPKGEWWTVFHDVQLDALEKEALASNQTLKISLARLEQAKASALIQTAALFPTVSATPSAERQRLSANRPTNGIQEVLQPAMQNTYYLPFNVNYEVDLFGKVRRSIEAANAAYQASAADLENMRLLVTSQLAGDYFSAQQLDLQLDILNRTVDTLQKGLDLVNQRHEGGVASGLDVAQEQTLLESTRTQATLLLQQRKQYEDAIAVLLGRPAPDFHLAHKAAEDEPPPINLGLPSDLLERRPDIAEAERNMAQANAQIGVAKSAYYPSLNLFGQGGWETQKISTLVNAGSGFWAIGANAAQTIFNGGALHAQVRFAQAGWDASVASYRQTVLTALQEVQDDITGLTVLGDARQSQQQAVDSARHALDISTNRYTGGLVSYLDVVTAQQNLLTNETQLAVIRGQRLVVSVMLVKALGGGWDASSLAAIQVKPKLKDLVTP